jgi:threonine/homoserine/homoserine lactone efflux protein
MDLGIIVAVAMLLVWAGLTFIVNDAPGLTHALLIAGLSLLIWRVVKRDVVSARGQPPQR